MQIELSIQMTDVRLTDGRGGSSDEAVKPLPAHSGESFLQHSLPIGRYCRTNQTWNKCCWRKCEKSDEKEK
ncbi:MAG TPA: hypothetical protein VNM69_08955 [Bacillus sp. (in: firmicutes)]|nr:hypothetical protein [Bacillus sp. (in: firmicutes)]